LVCRFDHSVFRTKSACPSNYCPAVSFKFSNTLFRWCRNCFLSKTNPNSFSPSDETYFTNLIDMLLFLSLWISPNFIELEFLSLNLFNAMKPLFSKICIAFHMINGLFLCIGRFYSITNKLPRPCRKVLHLRSTYDEGFF